MNNFTVHVHRQVQDHGVGDSMPNPGAGPEILKRGGALYRAPWLAGEKKIRFQIV